MITNNESEKQRLTSLLFSCGVSEDTISLLEPTIENVAWMKEKLDDTRATIAGSGVAIPYDSKGSQKSIKENPLFKGYESLWKSYMSGMCKLLEYVPRQVVESEVAQIETPKTVLELVRDRHRKQA